MHEFRHVAVREVLRSHADEAARYAALKRQVAAHHSQDRLAYIEGNDGYVTASNNAPWHGLAARG